MNTSHEYKMKKEVLTNINCAKKFEKKMKEQKDIYSTNVNDRIVKAEEEVEIAIKKEFSERAEWNRLKYYEDIAIINAVASGINDVLKEYSKKEQELFKLFLIWSTCQSLYITLNSYDTRRYCNKSLHFLKYKINTFKKITEAFPKIYQILETLPNQVINRGVCSKENLVDRFYKVEKKAYQMGIIKKDDPNIFDIVFSYIISTFVYQESKSIPQNEIDNVPINIHELNTYDKLQRAKYWMKNNNFLNALKFMNLLDGGAKIVAKEWITEMTYFLETMQVVDVLTLHALARLSGLTKKPNEK